MGEKTSIDAQLGAAKLILEGGMKAVPELKARLAAVSYDEAALTTGYDLYVAAGGQRITAYTEHGQQLGATIDLNLLRDKVEHQYSTLAQISKTVFEQEVDVLAALGLQRHKSTGPASDDPNAPAKKPARPSDAQAALVGRAKQLYGGIIAQPDLVTQLTPVGYPAERLQQELDDVTALENADVAQEREKGEAKGAKAQQKAALTALNDWVHRFTGIVVPALSDRPDLLAMLGLKPRGGKR